MTCDRPSISIDSEYIDNSLIDVLLVYLID